MKFEILKNLIEKPISGEWGIEGDGIYVLRTTNFQNDGRLNLRNVVRRNISQKKIEQKRLRNGDIIIEKSGGSPNQPVGRVVYFDQEGDYLCNNFTSILRPKNGQVFSKYLHYLLFASHKYGVVNRFQNKTTGIINLQLERYIQKVKIPLPPLSTQQQIARILDQADALRKKTQQVIDLYDQLAQSIFLDMFGDPVRNPKGWEITTIKRVTIKIGSGATPRGGKESYLSEGISLIRSLNVHDGLFKMKDLAYISDSQAKKLNNVSVEEEDVLLNITGASVCRCTVVPANILPARVNQHVTILRCEKRTLNPFFLLHTLVSENSKRKLLSIASKGGATREALTKEDIEKYTIPLPPITLQNQFAEKISLIEKQKELAKQSLQESENLFNALLQKAFKGELVNSV